MLAPRTTPTACCRVIRELFTKPTVITVVALELCTRAVTSAPAATPMNLLEVRAFRMVFILLPATLCRLEDIICIPSRNTARPPAIWNAMAVTSKETTLKDAADGVPSSSVTPAVTSISPILPSSRSADAIPSALVCTMSPSADSSSME